MGRHPDRNQTFLNGRHSVTILLLGAAVFSPLIIVFLVVAMSKGIETESLQSGYLVIGLAVLFYLCETYWPRLKTALLNRGVPTWCFESGWRSAALLSGTVSAVLTCVVVYRGEAMQWLLDLPAALVFLFFFTIYMSIFHFLPTLWKRWRAARQAKRAP